MQHVTQAISILDTRAQSDMQPPNLMHTNHEQQCACHKCLTVLSDNMLQATTHSPAECSSAHITRRYNCMPHMPYVLQSESMLHAETIKHATDLATQMGLLHGKQIVLHIQPAYLKAPFLGSGLASAMHCCTAWGPYCTSTSLACLHDPAAEACCSGGCHSTLKHLSRPAVAAAL